MKKYEVMLTRQATQTVTVQVNARSVSEAKRLAIQLGQTDRSITWEWWGESGKVRIAELPDEFREAIP